MKQHVLRNTAATVSATLKVDNVATDPTPDSATVVITREDGTTLVASTAAVNAGTGVFSYTLTPTHTATLDELKLTWTATLNGYAQSTETFVEVVGGFVCSLDQIDAELSKGGTAASYPLANKQAARDVATQAFEAECGVAFTPRYGRTTIDGEGTTDLGLTNNRVLSITSATVTDTALTSGELADVAVYGGGSLYNPLGWAKGRQNIELKYEHGHRTAPADVSRAVAILAAHILKDGPFDDRGYGITDDGGAVRLLTAGVSGASFSIPDVQSALARHRYSVIA